MDLAVVVDRVVAAIMAALKTLSGMSGETLAIIVVGVIGGLISLGCVIFALAGEWRQWAQTRFAKGNRD